MARTAHHPRPTATRDRRPWRRLVLHDLRYSRRVLDEAALRRGRPRPQAVRRRVEVHCFLRGGLDRGITVESAIEERRARRRLRAQVGVLLRTVNSPGGPLRTEAADLVDVPPVRHRHSSLW
ncbi:hypothetical protein ACF08N_14730 [Streptomyces sp. NPDC015127]|uniref:hypothetical protein n=1 Tax=Streptomyces sp. NPDC015127 TaxID=3364939 RepID=UPI0036FC0481